MSLVAVSLRLATEPNTKAAVMRFAAAPCRAQRLGQAYGLPRDGTEFGKDRRLRIGLIVFLRAHARNRHQPALRQSRQLALYRAGAAAGELIQLGRKEAAFRLAEQISQHPLRGWWKTARRPGSCASWKTRFNVLTHIGRTCPIWVCSRGWWARQGEWRA